MTLLFYPPFLQLDEFDAYIIVSFVNATLVLSIGETVEEVTDSGFLGTTPTLSCSLLGDDALVQVRMYPFVHSLSRPLPPPPAFQDLSDTSVHQMKKCHLW